MKLQIRVDEQGIISDVKFKTFGCGSAIASSSYMTERVKGLSLEEAGKIKNTEIAKELCLPPVKLHCSSKCGVASNSFVYTDRCSIHSACGGCNSFGYPGLSNKTLHHGQPQQARLHRCFAERSNRRDNRNRSPRANIDFGGHLARRSFNYALLKLRLVH